MSEETALRAGRQRLAHALGCTVENLGPLVDVTDTAALSTLNRGIRRHLSAAEARRLRAVVAAAVRLPAKLVAVIAERQFGPTLCAAAISAVEVDLAVDIAGHLSHDFMVEITLASDPDTAGHLAAHLPTELTTALARDVIARREDLVAAAFVGPIAPDQVAAILHGVHDHAAVVRIAMFVEDTSLLDEIVARLEEDYLDAIIEAVRREGLWPLGLNLLGHLGTEQQVRVVTKPVFAHTEVVREILAAVVTEPHLITDLAELVQHVPDETFDTYLAVLEDLVEEVQVLWGRLDEHRRQQLLEIVGQGPLTERFAG